MKEEKRVIFCGASAGLGRYAALYFLENGWTVFNLDIIRNPEIEEMGVRFYPCNVADHEETKKTIDVVFAHEGSIHALINCIRFRNTSSSDLDVFPKWKKVLSVDLDTYYNASYAFAENAKERGNQCSIISLSSVTCSVVTLAEEPGYHVAKAGINQMMRHFAAKYGPFGVRANAIAPGLISNVHAEMSSNSPTASEYSRIAQHIPLRRSGSPEDIAHLLYFLASEQSSFITGQCICIDGGLSMRDQVDFIRPHI